MFIEVPQISFQTFHNSSKHSDSLDHSVFLWLYSHLRNCRALSQFSRSSLLCPSGHLLFLQSRLPHSSPPAASRRPCAPCLSPAAEVILLLRVLGGGSQSGLAHYLWTKPLALTLLPWEFSFPGESSDS